MTAGRWANVSAGDVWLAQFDWGGFLGQTSLTGEVFSFLYIIECTVACNCEAKPHSVFLSESSRECSLSEILWLKSAWQKVEILGFNHVHGQEVVHAEPQKITMDLPLPFPTFVIDAQTSPEGCPCRRSPSSRPIPGRWWGGVDSCYYGYDSTTTASNFNPKSKGRTFSIGTYFLNRGVSQSVMWSWVILTWNMFL